MSRFARLSTPDRPDSLAQTGARASAVLLWSRASSALSIMDCRVEVIGGVGHLDRQYGAFLLIAAR
ncbi:MAG: hypothetical protein ACKVVP_04500, partial [Chloroflexota bacterium]